MSRGKKYIGVDDDDSDDEICASYHLILQTGDAIPRFTEKEKGHHRPNFHTQDPLGASTSLTS
jgi:hypothetical protein